MPNRLELGDAILTPSLAPKLVKQLPAPRTVSPPIQRGRYTRNGQFPDIALINAMNAQTNQGILFRTKEVFRGVGPVAASTAGALSNGILASAAMGDRERWRFAFHSGPYAHTLRAVVCMVPQDVGADRNSYARIDVANAAGTIIATAKFYHGTETGGTSGVTAGWDHLKPITMYLDVAPDTDYFATVYDVDRGRIQSACVHELASMTENVLGYLPQNIAAGSDVLETYRRNLVTLQYNLWRRGGATVLNWCINDFAVVPMTTNSLTFRNIIDNTSTAVSAATPGYSLAMAGKERAGQTAGVGCVMKAYGKMASGASLGRVILVNSAGATVATIADVWGATPSWQSVAFSLPATSDKYDLMFARGATTDAANPFSLYAVSIYEYEP